MRYFTLHVYTFGAKASVERDMEGREGGGGGAGGRGSTNKQDPYLPYLANDGTHTCISFFLSLCKTTYRQKNK